MSKISFDTTTRIINIIALPDFIDGENVITLDIATELYSQGKIDWVADETLRKLKYPISATGGDSLPGSKDLGSTYFIKSDWKIAPYEGNHRFIINGNFYSIDGKSPFNRTLGNYNVFLEQTVSSLVDSTVSQLPEIEQASFEGGLTIDAVYGTPGTKFDIFTPKNPGYSLVDLHSVYLERGLATVYVIGDLVVDNSADFSNFMFVGSSPTKSSITLLPEATVTGAEFYDAHVLGTLDGNSQLERCVIDNLNYIEGVIYLCIINPGIISLASDNTKTAHILDCFSGVPGTGTPRINCGGDGANIAMRGYRGGISLFNKTGSSKASIDLDSGQAILENTVTNGSIVARGVGKLIDENGDHIPTGMWNGVSILNETSLYISSLSQSASITEQDKLDIADRVWDEIMSDHLTAGSTGSILGNISTDDKLAIAKEVWDRLLSSHLISGSAGKVLSQTSTSVDSPSDISSSAKTDIANRVWSKILP